MTTEVGAGRRDTTAVAVAPGRNRGQPQGVDTRVTDQFGPASKQAHPGKYAQVERERRFLLGEPPVGSDAARVVTITDRYLPGTRLRLRRAERQDSGTLEYKFTLKVPDPGLGARQGWVTNLYLTRVEYELLATLPAAVLLKTRLSIPPLGIDIFHGPLDGLVLAEAEFASDDESTGFIPPLSCVAEVTDDARFTGGRLVHANRRQLLAWMSDYGITP